MRSSLAAQGGGGEGGGEERGKSSREGRGQAREGGTWAGPTGRAVAEGAEMAAVGRWVPAGLREGSPLSEFGG